MSVFEIILFIVCLVVMLSGLVGIFLPLIPAVPLIWFACLAYGLFTNFKEINFNFLTVCAAFTIFSVVMDYVAGAFGAKKMGASRWGIIGAILGLIIGFIVGNILGLIIGPFVGALLFELIGGKNFKAASKAGLGTFIGYLGSAFIKIIIGVVIIGVFIWNVLA